MNELRLYSLLALMAGTRLNLMPCALPVMPFKIQAVRLNRKGVLSDRFTGILRRRRSLMPLHAQANDAPD